MGNAIRPANDLVSLLAVLRSRRPGACANVFCAKLGRSFCWPLLSDNGSFLGSDKRSPKTGGRESDKSIVVRKAMNKVAIQRSGWSEVT
jgi:hypothetical protein